MLSTTTSFELINVVVDNSNPNYPNSVILVYWRLVSSCPEKSYKVTNSYATNLIPNHNNFVPLESIDDQMIATWVQNHYGPNYSTLVERNKELLMAEFEPPDGATYRYNQNLGIWQ